jgi:ABC-type transport system involved in cytochrome c biogenesis permease component
MSTVSALFRYDWRVRSSDARRLLGGAFNGALLTCLGLLFGQWQEASGLGHWSDWLLYVVTAYVAVSLHLALWLGLRERVRRHQEQGVLEACVMTRTPLWHTLVAMPTWDVATALFWGALWLGIAYAATGVATVMLLPALLTVILTVSSVWMIGVASATVSMALRASDPIASVLVAGVLISSGVVVPRGILPDWAGALGGLFPAAPMVDALRALGSDDLVVSVWSYPTTAAVQAVVCLCITVVTVRTAIARVQADGAFGLPD